MTQRIQNTTTTARPPAGRRFFRFTAVGVGLASFGLILAWSGVTAFQRHTRAVPLAATDDASAPRPAPMGDRPAPRVRIAAPATTYEEVGVVSEPTQPEPAATAARAHVAQPAANASTLLPAGVKFDRLGKVIMVGGKPWTGEVFDSRPIRAVRTQTMKTTAYSPDERSCGKWADGITASGRSVWMNGGRLVAADKAVPFGTILTIPGYNSGKPVQVWDRGGAIKGNRLDLLYPTHEIAMQWGVQNKQVVFWEFVKTD